MTTDEQIRDLQRALKNVNTSIRYYEAELARTSALKPRFNHIKAQIAALKSRQWKLEGKIKSIESEAAND